MHVYWALEQEYAALEVYEQTRTTSDQRARLERLITTLDDAARHRVDAAGEFFRMGVEPEALPLPASTYAHYGVQCLQQALQLHRQATSATKQTQALYQQEAEQESRGGTPEEEGD